MWNCFSSKKMSALLQRMLHSCKYFKFPAEFPANQIVFEACFSGAGQRANLLANLDKAC